MLLYPLLDILADWRPAFTQGRSHRRAVAQALGTLVSFGRRTLSRAIRALGHQQQDWSAAYKLHSRADWNPDRLFQPIIERALPLCGGPYIAAVNTTRTLEVEQGFFGTWTLEDSGISQARLAD